MKTVLMMLPFDGYVMCCAVMVSSHPGIKMRNFFNQLLNVTRWLQSMASRRLALIAISYSLMLLAVLVTVLTSKEHTACSVFYEPPVTSILVSSSEDSISQSSKVWLHIPRLHPNIRFEEPCPGDRPFERLMIRTPQGKLLYDSANRLDDALQNNDSNNNQSDSDEPWWKRLFNSGAW